MALEPLKSSSGTGVVRIKLQDTLEFGHRLAIFPQSREAGPEIKSGVREFGLDPQGLRTLKNGLLQATQPLKDITEIVVALRISGGQPQGFLQLQFCFLEVPPRR